MQQAIDIFDELDKVDDGTFLELVAFNQTQLGCCSIQGESPVWEMHPDTDELFIVLDGEMQILLAEDDGEKRYTIPSGNVFVVPQGMWHKPSAKYGVKFVYCTPGRSLHSERSHLRYIEV